MQCSCVPTSTYLTPKLKTYITVITYTAWQILSPEFLNLRLKLKFYSMTASSHCIISNLLPQMYFTRTVVFFNLIITFNVKLRRY